MKLNCLLKNNFNPFYIIIVFTNLLFNIKNIYLYNIAFLRLKLYLCFFNKELKESNFITEIGFSNQKKKAYSNVKKLLVLKFLKLKLEKLIFKTTYINTKIEIKNLFQMFHIKTLLKIPKKSIIWRHWKLFFFNDFINILFFSIFFKKSYILSSFISKNITNKKAHFNFLKKIKKITNQFFDHSVYYNLSGLYIRVHGKFQGRLRKRRFKYSFGFFGLSALKTVIDYDLQKSYTKFGVFSIKVWLLYCYDDHDEKNHKKPKPLNIISE